DWRPETEKQMNKRLWVYLCAVWCMFTYNQAALYAHRSYYFKHYNINNGLSQNTVQRILQDRKGFMWFGTKDGLNRFDGTSFKIFHFSTNSELKDNVFRCILQDEDESIWVGTDDGVYIYNSVKETFSRFSERDKNQNIVEGAVSDMIMDEDGDIWISVEEKGVFHYAKKTKELFHYDIKTTPGGLKGITLCADKDGGVWAFPYSSRPFMYIDKKKRQTKEFKLYPGNEFLFDAGEINVVLADPFNQLLVGTSRKGLLRINTVNGNYEVLLDKDENNQPIFVRDVLRVGEDILWIGSESGIYIYSFSRNSVIHHLKHDDADPNSISDNAIYSLYKDNENGIWVGSYFGGVDYYSEQYGNFEKQYPVGSENSISGRRIREFCPAPDGNIWIGTEDNGLNLFDPASDTFLPLPPSLDHLYNNIHALYAENDAIWIGTFSKGLNRYNVKTKTLKTYINTDSQNSISENSIFSLCKDRQGTLWVGTLSGLNIYNPETDDFTRIKQLEGLFIQDIKEDTDGNVWFATFLKGLYRYRPKDKTWKNYMHNPLDSTTLAYNKVTSIFEDSRERLWITTEGGGFCLYEKETESFRTMNDADGLPNNVVYQIKEDRQGRLWLSTNRGLVCFDPDHHTFKSYTIESGLKSNQFNYKSSYKAPDGTLYFGSIDGFVRFNPDSFKEYAHTPPLVLTDLYINNEPANISDKNTPLSQSILYADALELPYHKNSFSLRYAVLSYTARQSGGIEYMLEGFDEEWIRHGAGQSIIYTNLRPGTYTLKIILKEGPRTIAAKNLTIRIKPPLWMTTWAYLVYFILLAAAVFALLYHLQQREVKMQRRKMRIFQQEKERELYRSKMNFFTDIAHEIRTPLSLIKAPLDHVLLTEPVSGNLKENLEIMHKNTDRLLSLVNQLLDFRKTEAEAYALHLVRYNVTDLLRETFIRFLPLVKQKNTTFHTDLPQTDILAKIDKEAFLKIISNLLNNALKYGESLLNVNVFVDEREPVFHVVVQNDGDVISPEHRNEIFKPFVHIDKNKDKVITGTGIGLALSLSLAELHNGSLFYTVDDGLNGFHLVLPIGDAEPVPPPAPEIQGKSSSKSTHADSLLVVEDDREMLQFIAKCLSPHYEVFTAENGEQALKILQDNGVNCIISDVMMPGMDGFEFTKRIKSDVEFSHIPVILLTAKTNVQAKVKGFEIGADDYIEKPFSIEVLLARIANLLNNRNKLRETFLKHPFIGTNTIALTKSDGEFLKKLNEIVQENLHNPDFNVEIIAELVNMSRASFYRKIKGILNLTPNEYIKVERLKKAAQLLKDKEYKVNEICYMVGFNSPSYFARCFQQQFGMLPKDF
ncbi:MAG TPA: hybrid sensor histidine kinase/response regulator, partial [Porphyromonadaceae bacterium]|nr:hybrid sensor histidine kinase/response regulator [Porphyromonadaceae bacterium]